MTADKQQLAAVNWKRVRCPKYHALGNMIAALEDEEDGIDPKQGKKKPAIGIKESLLPGEQTSCLRGRIGMVMRVLMWSLQAVIDCKPQYGDEVEVCALVVRSGVDTDVQWGIERAREKALGVVSMN